MAYATRRVPLHFAENVADPRSFFPDDPEPDPVPAEHVQLHHHLARLPRHYREILWCRSGLDGREYTFVEVAAQLGVSKSKVQRDEKTALNLLREMHGLDDHGVPLAA